MINTKTNTKLILLIFSLLFFCFYSCEKNEPLIFQKKTIQIDDVIDCKNMDCVLTEIELVTAINETQIAENINHEIEKRACLALNIEEEFSIQTIEEAILGFNSSYQNIKEKFSDEIIPYEASIYSEINFQNANILSVLVDSYIFTGGAHGSGITEYINLDIKTGKSIENTILIKDHHKFSAFVEKIFRKTYKIPENESINSSGFFFENNTFILPENIGFAENQVILLYNQYEISSYAEGPIELKLDKKEVANFFSVDVL